MTIAIIARLTLGELVRRRLVAAVAALTAAIVALTAWGLLRLAGATVEGAAIAPVAVRATAAGITLMLAFLFSFVIAFGAALVAGPAVAAPIENGEILALLARPVRRGEVLAGRWLGTVLSVVAYVAAAGALELSVIRATTGYVPPHPLTALAYLAGVAVVVTTMAVLLATRLGALTAGILAALLFGLAWIGGILEAVGLTLGNRGLADAGTLVTLAFPSDALWRGALDALQPAVFGAAVAGAAAQGVVNPFAVSSPPTPALLGWTAGWVAVVFGAALWSFRERDL